MKEALRTKNLMRHLMIAIPAQTTTGDLVFTYSQDCGFIDDVGLLDACYQPKSPYHGLALLTLAYCAVHDDRIHMHILIVFGVA
jgi:hypothetical protein